MAPSRASSARPLRGRSGSARRARRRPWARADGRPRGRSAPLSPAGCRAGSDTSGTGRSGPRCRPSPRRNRAVPSHSMRSPAGRRRSRCAASRSASTDRSIEQRCGPSSVSRAGGPRAVPTHSTARGITVSGAVVTDGPDATSVRRPSAPVVDLRGGRRGRLGRISEVEHEADALPAEPGDRALGNGAVGDDDHRRTVHGAPSHGGRDEADVAAPRSGGCQDDALMVDLVVEEPLVHVRQGPLEGRIADGSRRWTPGPGPSGRPPRPGAARTRG